MDGAAAPTGDGSPARAADLRSFERRRTIDLLPDREVPPSRTGSPTIPTSRSCVATAAADIAKGADKGAPRALQIADRWHLLENATAAFVEAIKRQMRPLRRAVTSGDIDSDVLTSVEKLQWIEWQRRDGINEIVRGLRGQGRGIKAIVRTTGVSRQTVRRILAGTRDDERLDVVPAQFRASVVRRRPKHAYRTCIDRVV